MIDIEYFDQTMFLPAVADRIIGLGLGGGE